MPGLSAPSAGHLLDVSVLIEHFAAATAAHCAGRREAGFMAEALADDNPAQAVEARKGAARKDWRRPGAASELPDLALA
jgi:hypothetical protein